MWGGSAPPHPLLKSPAFAASEMMAWSMGPGTGPWPWPIGPGSSPGPWALSWARPWSMGPGLGPWPWPIGPGSGPGPWALAWARRLAGWLAGRPKKSLNFFLERNRKFLRNFLMGSGSDTHVRIRKSLGNFLMGNLEIMKSRLRARIFSACS